MATQPQSKPHRDDAGKLTRAGMEHALKSGGSVLHNGEVITSLDQLPDEVTLAGTDVRQLQARLDDLDEQYGKLVLERDRTRKAMEAAQKVQAEGKPAAGGGTKPDAAPPVAQPARATHAAEQPHGAEPREPSPPEEPQPPKGRHR